ncbi:TIGR04255 family protein [Herbaspirillum huttiense]|uniref:TIGR04255 family protein n=1 Tax=Herbaspirillum huttiense TaxID=863372 RepID=UPI003B3A6CFA
MSTHFPNAPLKEVIIELRWEPPAQLGHKLFTANGGPQLFFPSADFEAAMQNVSAAVEQRGYKYVERVAPSGVPIPMHHIVCRYKEEPQSMRTLFQYGPGVFTVNATTPYKSWDDFTPIVRAGIEAICAARSSEEKDLEFSVVSLRYVDMFGPALVDGVSSQAFIQDILGFKTELPNALSRLIDPEKEVNVVQNISLPLNGGLQMSVEIGEGTADGEKGVVMATTLSTLLPTAPNMDAVWSQLESAHKIIHGSFMTITEKLHAKMGQLQ